MGLWFSIANAVCCVVVAGPAVFVFSKQSVWAFRGVRACPTVASYLLLFLPRCVGINTSPIHRVDFNPLLSAHKKLAAHTLTLLSIS
jgi:hypothetical protein